MRITIGLSADATDWFDALDPPTLRDGLYMIRDLLLAVGVEGNFREKALQSITSHTLMSESARNILQTFVQKLPHSTFSPPGGPELALGKEYSFETFNRFQLGETAAQICSSKTFEVTPGESRAAVFQRLFVPLASVAKRITIFDPYGVNALIRGGDAAWLLRQIASLTYADITIHSRRPDSNLLLELKGLRYRDYKNELARIVSESLFENVPKNSRCNLQVKIHDYLGEHNRRITFHFDSGVVSVVLEKGIESMDKSIMAETFIFAPGVHQEAPAANVLVSVAWSPAPMGLSA